MILSHNSFLGNANIISRSIELEFNRIGFFKARIFPENGIRNWTLNTWSSLLTGPWKNYFSQSQRLKNIKSNHVIHLLIVIIRLMLSDSLCPKVITLSGFHCTIEFCFISNESSLCRPSADRFKGNRYRCENVIFFLLEIERSFIINVLLAPTCFCRLKKCLLYVCK